MMLAYAASRPVVVDRRPHPNTMLLIVGVHVAVIAAVMSAKMEIQRHQAERTTVISIPLPPDPPPVRQIEKPQAQQTQALADRRQTIRKSAPPDSHPVVDLGGKGEELASGGGNGMDTRNIPLPPFVQSVRSGPRLLTPPSELKPPYPSSKLLNEEEATLTLKLTIDANGRVIAVEPVGRADATFLDSARKYLISHWRYEPASEDGHAVATTTIINLRFELNG